MWQVARAQWAGRSTCWSAEYPFSRCCDTRKGPTGDKSCWGAHFNYKWCWCEAPKNCSGAYRECTGACTKQYVWNTTNAEACVTQVPRRGALEVCQKGEGECATAARNCAQPLAPEGGTNGTCRGPLAHGRSCDLRCKKNYLMYGTGHPQCHNGTVKGLVFCKWNGKQSCWNKQYTYSRCCSTRNGELGDKNCWGGAHTPASCWCQKPKACRGLWGQCSANCTKHFRVIRAGR